MSLYIPKLKKLPAINAVQATITAEPITPIAQKPIEPKPIRGNLFTPTPPKGVTQQTAYKPIQYAREIGRDGNIVRYEDGSQVNLDSGYYKAGAAYKSDKYQNLLDALPGNLKAMLGHWSSVIPDGSKFVDAWLQGKSMQNIWGNTSFGYISGGEFADRVSALAQQALDNLQAQQQADKQAANTHAPAPKVGASALYIPSPYI